MRYTAMSGDVPPPTEPAATTPDLAYMKYSAEIGKPHATRSTKRDKKRAKTLLRIDVKIKW